MKEMKIILWFLGIANLLIIGVLVLGYTCPWIAVDPVGAVGAQLQERLLSDWENTSAD